MNTPAAATAVALMSYVPQYAATIGLERLFAAAPEVLAVEVLVQGVIAGAGTLYTGSRMVALRRP